MVIYCWTMIIIIISYTNYYRLNPLSLCLSLYTVLPTVYILRTGPIAISCFSSGIPPTNISWYRNGKRISANGGTVRTSQQVTDYGRSLYNNTIFIGGDEVVGSFHCQISDHFGRRNSSHVSIQGSFDNFFFL